MGKRKEVIVAPPAELPLEKGNNGGGEAVPEDFWDIDEPAVLGLFVGHYYEISIDTFFNFLPDIIHCGTPSLDFLRTYSLSSPVISFPENRSHASDNHFSITRWH